ncbi:THUMP domain-containing class I SAM-dependent RNA methyltransferase [Acetobacterium woodii]|uniref:Methyltransferase n=1 Tax=Acetobacterium woodii (strain ATCC 29683 / DSM 1030 / JCM 2381 / KCTC 1655 / WB1) TaxID=931626 RepID=H6LGV8_ACEWD|nr:class I SAM-dependent RNA methyltransferase [Acetobacterium woodii]AFA49622.1 methyltransferase [Acetobacterium woodii DSM 1030]
MSKKINLIATVAFGIESVVKEEIKKLGYEVTEVENGKIRYCAPLEAIPRSNLWLRCADRVLLEIGRFKAVTFDELFEKTKALPWENWIPVDGEFPAAKITSVKSTLFSKSDGQRIVKKAVVERLKSKYHVDWFEENGGRYPIHIQILKDEVTLSLDTSGSGLNKRGYRQYGNEAPLKETISAALVYLSHWRPDRFFLDPLCGSGTIVIEAAMMGKNIAPGLKRDFVSETWAAIPADLWEQARQEAEAAINDKEFLLLGSDCDPDALKQARTNAELAGVTELVAFQKLPVQAVSTKKKYGVIITNPPYGERIGEEKEIQRLYRDMGKVFRSLDDWSYFIITGYEKFEKYFGQAATKNRKLYNGDIKTHYYQYYGPLPPRKRRVDQVETLNNRNEINNQDISSNENR